MLLNKGLQEQQDKVQANDKDQQIRVQAKRNQRNLEEQGYTNKGWSALLTPQEQTQSARNRQRVAKSKQSRKIPCIIIKGDRCTPGQV
jgi:hypothetical protein